MNISAIALNNHGIYFGHSNYESSTTARLKECNNNDILNGSIEEIIGRSQVVENSDISIEKTEDSSGNYEYIYRNKAGVITRIEEGVNKKDSKSGIITIYSQDGKEIVGQKIFNVSENYSEAKTFNADGTIIEKDTKYENGKRVIKTYNPDTENIELLREYSPMGICNIIKYSPKGYIVSKQTLYPDGTIF